ncbi:MAG: hypothetical protein LBU95_00980 [Rikenellaceae bacterium]|jgi:hypothetical protein|nr:hypothetical protein [Rikenellaceae bacterium]
MLISSTTATILIVALGAAIFGLCYLISKRTGKKWIGSVAIFACIGVFVLCSRTFPNVYTVHPDGTYTREVLLLPKVLPDGKLVNGNHCYLFNDSDRAICVETHYYGSYSPESHPDSDIGGHLPPHDWGRLPISSVDDFFRDAPSSVRTKSSGEIRYRVYSLTDEEYQALLAGNDACDCGCREDESCDCEQCDDCGAGGEAETIPEET